MCGASTLGRFKGASNSNPNSCLREVSHEPKPTSAAGLAGPDPKSDWTAPQHHSQLPKGRQQLPPLYPRPPSGCPLAHPVAPRSPPPGLVSPSQRNGTRLQYVSCFRRLLNDLAYSGQCSMPEGLIRSQDLPRPDVYLPKPLSPQDDRLLDQQLRAQDNLRSNTLLLLRATG